MQITYPVHKSHMKLYNACRWMAKRILIDGVPLEVGDGAHMGGAIHEANAAVRVGQISATAAYQEAASQEAADCVWAAVGKDPYANRPREIELYVAVDSSGKLLPGCTQETEAARGAYVSGTMDMVVFPDTSDPFSATRLLVHDDKSGRIETPDPFEQDVYVWLASQWATHHGHGHNFIVFQYHFLRSNNYVTRSYSVHNMGDVWARICSAISEIERLDPIPIPGHHCSWCQFMGNGCPLGVGIDATFNAPVPANTPPAVHMGQVLQDFITNGDMPPELAPVVGFGVAWLDAKTAVLKKLLREWIIVHGEFIRVGDSVWRVDEDDGDTWDHPMALAILDAHEASEEDRIDVLRVTKMSVNRLKKRNPQLYDALMTGARIAKPPKFVLRQHRLPGGCA